MGCPPGARGGGRRRGRPLGNRLVTGRLGCALCRLLGKGGRPRKAPGCARPAQGRPLACPGGGGRERASFYPVTWGREEQKGWGRGRSGEGVGVLDLVFRMGLVFYRFCLGKTGSSPFLGAYSPPDRGKWSSPGRQLLGCAGRRGKRRRGGLQPRFGGLFSLAVPDRAYQTLSKVQNFGECLYNAEEM